MKQIYELNYTEVRRILVDTNQDERRPLLSQLFPDILNLEEAPPPGPADVATPVAAAVWQEMKHQNIVADFMMPGIGERYVNAITRAMSTGATVPLSIRNLELPRFLPKLTIAEYFVTQLPGSSQGVAKMPRAVQAYLEDVAGSDKPEVAQLARDLLAQLTLDDGSPESRPDRGGTRPPRPR